MICSVRWSIWSSAEETDGGYEYALAFTGIENLDCLKQFMADLCTASETTTFGSATSLDKLLVAGEVAEKDQLDTGDDIDGLPCNG